MKDEKTKKQLLIFGVLGLVGLLDSAWLLFLHFSQDTMNRVCQLGSSISCSVLEVSRYSEWFGVPVPMFSVLFYLFVSFLAFSARQLPENRRQRPAVYLFFLSMVSIFASLYMASISFFVLKTLCPFCAVLYVIAFAQGWVSFQALKAFNQPWGHLIQYDAKNGWKSPWFFVPALLSIVVLFGTKTYLSGRPDLKGEVHLIATERDRTKGSEDAPIVITEFSDFECPYCRIAGDVLSELEAQMRGKIKVVYKFYPLDMSCNPRGGSHRFACLASRAAYCASVQKKFWPFHDLLFIAQREISEGTIFQIAQQTQLDIRSFEQCLSSEEANKAIQRDLEEGNQLQIRGTPSLFINGREYAGKLTIMDLQATIESILQENSPSS